MLLETSTSERGHTLVESPRRHEQDSTFVPSRGYLINLETKQWGQRSRVNRSLVWRSHTRARKRDRV